MEQGSPTRCAISPKQRLGLCVLSARRLVGERSWRAGRQDVAHVEMAHSGPSESLEGKLAPPVHATNT